jgi:lincosamide nucleotidyltransferase A/C/D/E
MMTSMNVLALLAAIDEAGAQVWVDGGRGTDAVPGDQTRPHRDLDLRHRAEQEPILLDLLEAKGFRETVDWRPLQYVMESRPRPQRLHPAAATSWRPSPSASFCSISPPSPTAS